jgi:hypothetical protein
MGAAQFHCVIYCSFFRIEIINLIFCNGHNVFLFPETFLICEARNELQCIILNVIKQGSYDV